MDKIAPPVNTRTVRRGGRFGTAKLATGLIAVGAAALVAGATFAESGANAGRLPQTAAAAAVAPASFADIVERVSPAVVSVQVEREAGQRLSQFMPDLEDRFNFDRFNFDRFNFDRLPDPFNRFFRRFEEGQSNGSRNRRAPETFRSEATGSGFIVDREGYIVTNHHVVNGARRITVRLADGREFQARIIGSDPDTDIALLKVDGVDSLPTVAFGDDRRLRVGDWVIAVGNPFGLGGTVTAGIVSSIGRDIGNGPYTDYIQIDAPINRGNSGGPTFDLSGQVVGVNTVIFSPSGGNVGIGFAVPASTVRAVVDQLKANGSVDRGWLGVEIQNLTPDMAESLGIPDQRGAIIARVVDDSPASRAGFRQGDVVIAVNGATLEDSRDLSRKVAALRAGERATFTVLRDGTRRDLTAMIERRDSARLASLDQNGGREAEAGPLGLALMPLNPSLRERYDLGENVTGVVITAVDPDSDAAQKGLRPGDVIVRAGNKSVREPSDVMQSVNDAKTAGRDSVLLLVANADGQRFVALRFANT